MLKEFKFKVGDMVIPQGWSHPAKIIEITEHLVAVKSTSEYRGKATYLIEWLLMESVTAKVVEE